MGLRGLVGPQGMDTFRELSLTELRIQHCITVLYFILFDIILISMSTLQSAA